tara:strand:+ start:314 stop:499 length:186 start_codon:yes stop_codon:yes gene_type:complete
MPISRWLAEQFGHVVCTDASVVADRPLSVIGNSTQPIIKRSSADDIALQEDDACCSGALIN